MLTKTTMMMTTNRFASALLALLLFAAVAAPLSAGDKKPDPKAPYALIFGTIFGPDDRPVRGVPIKIRREGDKHAIELVSDSNGEFAHRFPAGKADYVVWAALKDRQAAQKTEVKIHVDNDERQDLTLHLTK